jgi:carboxyl-terminal processing protease
VRKKKAFAALALVILYPLAAALPIAELRPSEVRALGHESMGWAATPPQTSDSRFEIRETGGTLLENVAAVLQRKYYDKSFATGALPGLVSRYTEKAKSATTLREQRMVVQEFLSHIPASHLGLISKQTYRYIFNDLYGRAYPTFGFQLVAINGKFYAFSVLEGGPAARAGLVAWDRIVSIDETAVEQSARLDWRSDDAYIPDARDPAVHYLTAATGDSVRLRIERRRGKFLQLTVTAENYSALAAARASVRLYKEGDHTFGYLHFWYVHMTGVPELLTEKLNGEFSTCDGVIIDLRGRGGNGQAISKILDVLRARNAANRLAVVALVDRQSRSAKDVLAYELKKNGLARLVGEPTAGAVIPATFADVGHETILMFPSFKLPRYTDLLELKPVTPDVAVERAGPLSAGDDPILKAGLAEAAKLVRASAKPASAN